MKRIDWIRQSGISVDDVAKMFADFLNEETPETLSKSTGLEIKTPAELEAQTGTNENITNDIVTYKEEDVNMDKSIKDQFLESSKNILGLVAEIHKKYGVIDFCNSGTRVHMKESEFLKVFSNDSITASVRDGEQFPYEYSVMVDGIKYFCISKLPPLEFGRPD